MPYASPDVIVSAAIVERTLEARELETFIRMLDPATNQYVVFDRASGWWARFPTAWHADKAMLLEFYKKKEMTQRQIG